MGDIDFQVGKAEGEGDRKKREGKRKGEGQEKERGNSALVVGGDRRP